MHLYAHGMVMRGVLVGYIALLLQHAIFGMRNACGFVARRSHPSSRSTAGHKECRQKGTAHCPQRTPWALKLSDPCNDGENTPARAVMSGASAPQATPSPGILAPLKESISATGGEGDEGSDNLLLYFAFGANMNPSILTTKRGVKPLKSFPAEATTFATKLGSSLKDERDAGQGLCMCFCHRAGKQFEEYLHRNMCDARIVLLLGCSTRRLSQVDTERTLHIPRCMY